MSSTKVSIVYRRDAAIEKTMHIIECASCSIDFGIGDNFMARRREDHKGFYCPNGHTNVYRGDNTEEKLRKELEQKERALRSSRDYAEAERRGRLKAQREKAAARGQVTKIKNRVGRGVCPCCNRSFANLGRHIAGQHPDFIGEPKT